MKTKAPSHYDRKGLSRRARPIELATPRIFVNERDGPREIEGTITRSQYDALHAATCPICLEGPRIAALAMAYAIAGVRRR